MHIKIISHKDSNYLYIKTWHYRKGSKNNITKTKFR